MMSATETSSAAILFLLFAGVIFMICGAGENRYMLIFIRQLQIILNLPLFKVVFPANFISFVAMTLMIAMFDFLEFFVDWDEVKFLEFEDIENAVADQAENVGYESHDMVKNLNTVAIVLILITA